MKEHVVHSIKESKASSIIIVAWSMGAMLSIELTPLFQERLKKLFLVGTTEKFTTTRKTDPNGWHPRILEKMKKQLSQNVTQVISQFDRQMFSDEEIANGYLEKWQLHFRQVLPNLDALHAGLCYLQKYHAQPSITNFQIPTYLLTGEKDTICPKDGALSLSTLFLKNNLCVLKEAGHIPFWTNPEIFFDWMKTRL
jgi:pimeloyl-[acyl-carrier protein] methyl ester esterase